MIWTRGNIGKRQCLISTRFSDGVAGLSLLFSSLFCRCGQVFIGTTMSAHHGDHAHHAHDAAHHAADHAHEHHDHGSFTKAKQPWVNPLTDPYRGWRFDKFAKRRMWFFGLAWGYGVVFGGWMSYRFLTEYNAWTYPVRCAPLLSALICFIV